MPFVLLLHQSWVLAVEELRDLMFRKRSVLSLLLYVVMVTLSLWLLFRVQRFMGTGTTIDLNAPEFAPLVKVLDAVGLLPYIDSLLRLGSLPEMLWVFQVFSIIWLPTLVALVSCDVVATDLYRGTLRFVLLRTSRPGYYVGKMLSHFIIYAILQLASLIGVVVLMWLRYEDFELGPALGTALEYFIVFLPFVWCMVAATQWISSWSRRPLNAIVRIHVFWIVLIVVAVKWPKATPFDIPLVVGLFLPFENYPLVSALGYSVWALAFTLVGLGGFMRRDV